MELATVKANWEDAAKADPLWAISTENDKDNGRWDAEEFFEQGRREVEPLLDLLPTCGGRALDFGCGVGRTSRVLADRYEEVTGLDISAEMVQQAKNLNPDLTFLVLGADTKIPFPSDHFDLVFSYLVLQHNPPTAALAFIREFVRISKGYVLIQAPRRWRAGDEPPLPHDETGRVTSGYPPAVVMHPLNETTVRGALRRAGAVVERELHTSEPGGWTSVVYLARKI